VKKQLNIQYMRPGPDKPVLMVMHSITAVETSAPDQVTYNFPKEASQ